MILRFSNFCFNFVKSTLLTVFGTIFRHIQLMKERIKEIMRSLHMTQQSFAQFLNVAPATLSSIFNDRTRPTLGIVEAIKNKIPNISTDWLMFGAGQMYLNDATSITPEAATSTPLPQNGELQFDDFPSSKPEARRADWKLSSSSPSVMMEEKLKVKNIYKPQRQITEIRIFYDDQTWETFVPKK